MPIALVLRYLPYILGAIAVIAALTMIYNKIYDNGYSAATAKYEARDAKTLAESQKLLASKNAEIEIIKKDHDAQFTGAIKHYAQTIENLNNDRIAADSRGLRINTKTNSTCSNALPTKGNIPGGSVKPSEEIHGGAELAEENRKQLSESLYQIEIGKRVCQELINFIERNAEIK